MKFFEGMLQIFRYHNRLCLVGLVALVMAIYFRKDSFHIQLLPNLNPLRYSVVTEFPNHSAEDVDLTLSLPLSNRISSLKSVKKIKTQSIHGKSTVQIELRHAAPSWEFKENLYQLLFESKQELPLGVGVSKLIQGHQSENPFLELVIPKKSISSGQDVSFLINRIQYQLERISGVVSVSVIGEPKHSLLLSLLEERLDIFPIKTKDIENQIMASIQSGSLGKIIDLHQETEIKMEAEIQSIETLLKFPIYIGEGKSIPLSQIANASMVSFPFDTITQWNGNDSIYIAIYVDPKQNPLKIANEMQVVLSEFQNEMRLLVYSDASQELKSQLKQFFLFLLFSLICGLGFSYFLYREWFPVFSLFVSVVFSLVIFFHLMVTFSISINLLSLSGISVGIGMLFDANNLIYYSIQAHWSEEKEKSIAVIRGIRSVIVSLISSSLTTMIVIIPLLLYVNEWKDFFYDIGFSIVLLVFSSFLTAITIVPFLFLTVSPKLAVANTQVIPFDLKNVPKLDWLSNHTSFYAIVFVFFLLWILIGNFASERFEIFPRPKAIGMNVEVIPKQNVSIQEELFLISEVRRQFERLYQNQSLLLLPYLSLQENVSPYQLAIPIQFKWFFQGDDSKFSDEIWKGFDSARWRVKFIPIESELSRSLPFLPSDSIVITHLDWQSLMDWMFNVMNHPSNIRQKGQFDFSPSEVNLKTWKQNSFPDLELQPDYDDLQRKILLKNNPKQIGFLQNKTSLPFYIEFLSVDRDRIKNKYDGLPKFKSHTQDVIDSKSLFQVEERKISSEYRREFGRFSLEWFGDLGLETLLLNLKEKGFQYSVVSSKNEIFSFYLTLLVLLLFSYVFVYLAFVGIYESFYRPFIYLLISLSYFLVVIAVLMVLLGEVHFGHYIGLLILLGLSLDSLSLFGERWEEEKKKNLMQEKIALVLSWIRKPVLLNAGSTWFGLLPVVLIVLPGSEFVRSIAITMSIGIMISLYFVFYLYPKIFSTYFDSSQ